MYPVKRTISKSEAYSPFKRVMGMNKITETMISVIGNIIASQRDTGFNNGDKAICSLKTAYSINLLMPVYKKRVANNRTIISIIVFHFIVIC